MKKILAGNHTPPPSLQSFLTPGAVNLESENSAVLCKQRDWGVVVGPPLPPSQSAHPRGSHFGGTADGWQGTQSE